MRKAANIAEIPVQFSPSFLGHTRMGTGTVITGLLGAHFSSVLLTLWSEQSAYCRVLHTNRQDVNNTLIEHQVNLFINYIASNTIISLRIVLNRH